MGNTTSVGEKIYRAAKANDVTELQVGCLLFIQEFAPAAYQSSMESPDSVI